MRIEFRYVDRNTCSRCRTTDKNVKKTVQGLQKALKDSGVSVDFRAKKLPLSKLAQSNSVLINGKDVESLVDKNGANFSACRGCSRIMKSSCECRTYKYRGRQYSYIPMAMIREALKNSYAADHQKS